MKSFHEALDVLIDSCAGCTKGTEVVSVRNSLGRVLAADVCLVRDWPDLSRSAVDGYAISFGDGRCFTCVGTIAAGAEVELCLEAGQCAAVMTGGVVPGGTDAVVRVEDCRVDGEVVEIARVPDAGELVNRVASEARAGDLIAACGQRIHVSLFPVLFNAGVSEVEVFAVPRVGLLLTGDELRDVDDGYVPGKVFETNRHILTACLEALHIPVVRWLQVEDDPEEIRRALADLGADCDVVVSSGGVSMGRYDYVKKIFAEADFEVLIDGTAIKPGRPLLVRRRRNTLYFGLPGYPSACLTNVLLYLVPVLKKLGGRSDWRHRPVCAKLATAMNSRSGKLYLNRVRVELVDGRWQAADPGSQLTSHFMNFAGVNGLVFLPPEVGRVEAGAEAEVLCFDLELR